MTKRIGTYVRQQHLALVALFLILAGGTALAVSAPKNSVKSKSVKNEALKSQDLKDGKAVAGADVVDDSLKGADVDEGSLNLGKVELPKSLPPSGPAGGALSGQYPNPAIGPNSVAGSQLTDNQVTGADVDESTLTTVPRAETALQGGLGRNGTGSCDPESETLVTCATAQINLAAPARVFVDATVLAGTEQGANNAFGACRIGSTAGWYTSAVNFHFVDGGDTTYGDQMIPLTAVSPVFQPGTYTVGIDCSQTGYGAIEYRYAKVVLVGLSAG